MAGITITADSGTQFEAGAAEYNSIARLDDDHFVVAYRDNNDYNKGKVNVGSRTGTSVTINEANAVIFNNDDTAYIQVRSLDSTSFVVTCGDVNSSKVYVTVGTISGTSITLGTPVNLWGGTGYSTVAALDASNFVSITGSSCRVCSVSGTTITSGGVQTALIVIGYTDSVGLDATHFVMVGRYDGIVAIAGTVDIGAKTITFGTAKTLLGSQYSYEYLPIIAKFDSQHFVVAVRDDVYDYNLKIVAATVNLTSLTITSGNVITIVPVGFSLSNYGLCAVNAYSFLVSYYTTTGTQAEVRSGTLTGDTTIAWDAQGAVVFDNDTSAYTSPCRLTDNYFILGYKSG